MLQKPAEVDKGAEKAKGLTLEELQAQTGDLLPMRLEMRRRRKKHRNDCLITLLGCNIL